VDKTRALYVGIVTALIVISIAGGVIYLSRPDSIPSPSPTPTPMPTSTPTGDIYEPDNNFTQYNPISITTFEQSQYRSIRPNGDIDCMRFYAEPGRYNFTVTDYPFDTYIQLYDESHDSLKFSQTNHFGFDILSSGYYFLEVSSAFPDVGAYVIHFKYQPSTIIELREAVARGLVQANITGRNLEEIDLTLKSNSDIFVVVEILPGTVFKADPSVLTNQVVQSMVVVDVEKSFLEPYGNSSFSINVACANMKLIQPTRSVAFIIETSPTSEDLTKLLNLADFNDAGFRIQQFAIWTITDDPAHDGYTSIGSSYSGGSGPSNTEIESIHALFVAAGIETQKYQVFK
jgi:hypothetical protein